MAIEIPSNLLFPDSRLHLYYEDEMQVNQTKSAITLEGTRNGFLTLANVLLFLRCDEADEILLHDLAFVHSDVELKIKFDYAEDGRTYGRIFKNNQGSFIWELTDRNLCLIAVEIHTLGYVVREVHMDDDMKKNEISFYCVVD